MKTTFARQFVALSFLLTCAGCGTQQVDVVDLNKVLDALVAVLDEGKNTKGAGLAGADQANVTASSGIGGVADVSGVVNLAADVASEKPAGAEVTSDAEIAAIEPEKQDPNKEKEFLTRFAAKLNEVQAMNSTVGVTMTPGGEIIGFKDFNADNVQDLGESKEFTVTIDPANSRLVASDNNGYHRPHSYGFSPSGMMMGYMLGSMMGRQGSYYSGPMSAAKPNFNSTSMSPSNYHKSAVSSVRSRSSASSMSSGAKARTGSKGFSFGK